VSDARDLVCDLRRPGVEIDVDDGILQITAPAGVLTDQIKGALAGFATSVNLTGQTSNIGPNVLLVGGGTAPAGLYRLSAALNTTTAGTAGMASLGISYTGNGVARTVPCVAASLSTLNTTGAGFQTLVFYSDGAANIQYSVAVSGAAGSPQYALQIALERLF
jgi:hypothetical protein